jgi:HK97 family phage major capsid protein
MRNAMKWVLLFLVPIVALSVAGHHMAAQTVAHYAPHVMGGAVLGPALWHGLSAITMLRTDQMPGITLEAKSRKATDLRGRANAIMQEIMADDCKLDATQLKAKAQEINDLNERANLIAGFTASDEIERQGGTAGTGVTQIAGSEATDQTRGGTRREDLGFEEFPLMRPMQEQIKEHALDVRRGFGSVRDFLRVAQGRDPVDVTNPKRAAFQRKVLARNLELQTMVTGGDRTRAIVGTAGDVSGGSFLLPLTQVQSIFSLANVQQGLLQRARAFTVPGRSLRIPYLIQSDTNASTVLNRPMAGQIANIGIVGEAATKPQATPQFGQRVLNVLKYAAYTQVSDEMLMDDFTGELPQEFINAVGQQTLNAINEDMTISGSDTTGATTPAGALFAGAAYNIAVTRQTPGTITTQDLFTMYSEFTHGPNAVWLASRRTVQKLYALSLTSSSLVTFLRDLNGLPSMMILGYPVVLTDILNTVGTTGDIALVNPDFYAFALRQALTVEMSREFAFTQDVTTYRFVVRGGGIPINDGKYAYKYAGSAGVDEHAPFTYLN